MDEVKSTSVERVREKNIQKCLSWDLERLNENVVANILKLLRLQSASIEQNNSTILV